MLILAAIALAAAPAASAEDIGPEPSTQQAWAIGEQAVKARLIDPESARIEWPYAFTGGSIKGLFTKRYAGWITCGVVNAKNRMGGYTGQAFFQVVINGGAVTMLDIGQNQELDTVAMSCQKMIKSGFLHPAASSALPAPTTIAAAAPQTLASAEARAQAVADKGGVGISFIPSPVGAVLMAVAPGSRAERAGLKPGETIETINGISIKGLDANAIVAILGSEAPTLSVKVVGVGEKVVNR